MTETWKSIDGYENKYEVSNYGRIRNTKSGKILKNKINCSTGYVQITLYNKGFLKTHLVHRLVAMAFIPNPKNLPQINHKNEIKTDNKVDNLEYCDNKYNSNYGTRNERISKPTYQYTLRGEFVKRWPSLTEIQRKLGFKKSNLSACATGKQKKAYNFIWRYDDKNI